MGLTDIFFPKTCLSCEKTGSYICTSCIKKVKRVKQVCPYCEKASVDGVTHTKCLKKLSLNGVYSVWVYEGVIRKALIKLKYKFATEIAEEISGYLSFILEDEQIFPRNSVLIPIPLYWLKENFRGFNQSMLIGRVLAEKMGWNFNPKILIRKRLNRPQTELKGKERRKNIKGVFSLKPNSYLLPTNYILFDDVYTTGSTLKEATKVLKRNGAKAVWGLTIAR